MNSKVLNVMSARAFRIALVALVVAVTATGVVSAQGKGQRITPNFRDVEISQVIEQRSGGDVRFKVASLYPLLYRLERRGWISGQWVEKEGQRRRRYYRLTREGRKVLAEQRQGWQRFVAAIGRITEVGNA